MGYFESVDVFDRSRNVMPRAYMANTLDIFRSFRNDYRFKRTIPISRGIDLYFAHRSFQGFRIGSVSSVFFVDLGSFELDL